MSGSPEGGFCGSSLTSEYSSESNQSCAQDIAWIRGRIGAALEAADRINEPDENSLKQRAQEQAPDYPVHYQVGVLQQTTSQHEQCAEHIIRALRDSLVRLNEIEEQIPEDDR